MPAPYAPGSTNPNISSLSPPLHAQRAPLQSRLLNQHLPPRFKYRLLPSFKRKALGGWDGSDPASGSLTSPGPFSPASPRLGGEGEKKEKRGAARLDRRALPARARGCSPFSMASQGEAGTAAPRGSPSGGGCEPLCPRGGDWRSGGAGAGAGAAASRRRGWGPAKFAAGTRKLAHPAATAQPYLRARPAWPLPRCRRGGKLEPGRARSSTKETCAAAAHTRRRRRAWPLPASADSPA